MVFSQMVPQITDDSEFTTPLGLILLNPSGGAAGVMRKFVGGFDPTGNVHGC